MEQTPFIWLNGQFFPWNDAKVHVLSHALHYGGGVFEGIRFYETENGPAIFRLEDHLKRFFYSASVIELKLPFTEEQIVQATVKLVSKCGIPSGYIRPLAFFGYGKMGINPTGAQVDVMIACWPWPKYLADRPLKAKISKYMRIHPQSLVTDAKVTGHYANSILASQEAHGAGYDEAILLDYEGNVAEGPGENIFMVKDGILLTPPAGKILPGITRNSVIQIAKDLGVQVQEKTISKAELFMADELFFTGTAAEVSPIGSVDGKNIGNGKKAEVTEKIREKYMDIVQGKVKEYLKWLTYVR